MLSQRPTGEIFLESVLNVEGSEVGEQLEPKVPGRVIESGRHHPIGCIFNVNDTMTRWHRIQPGPSASATGAQPSRADAPNHQR